jgi:hypothetical protein
LAERFVFGVEMQEQVPPAFTIKHLPGLEFGWGPISGREADPVTLALLDETINSANPDLLTPVESDDDGCSDGRPAIGTFIKGEEVFDYSPHRAKVFGGAVAMTAATRIGLGLAQGQPLREVLEESIHDLQRKNIRFGAHTADHTALGASGCGAIDSAPNVGPAVIKLENEIRGAIFALAGSHTASGLDVVQYNFRRYYSDVPSQVIPYSGRQVMDRIEAAGPVIKKLGGEHRERRIVINYVPGYTVNQGLIRLVTGDRAQVFAVDGWRLRGIAAGLYPDSDKQHKAELSELVYTLGTSAVLTKGDLPIDIIEPVQA